MSAPAGGPFPLPASQFGLTILEQDRLLPTLPGKAKNIVHVDGRVTTVQCVVCLRTATGYKPAAVIMLGHWNHEPDEGVPGHTPYKRCPDCRAAKAHPEATS